MTLDTLTSSRIKVNKVEYRYSLIGEGAPVVFFHETFGEGAVMLQRLGTALRSTLPLDDVRVLIFDRYYPHQSIHAVNYHTLPEVSTDARSLLSALGYERSIVIGDSIGGMIALQYAFYYPEAVAALALIESGPNLESDTVFGACDFTPRLGEISVPVCVIHGEDDDVVPLHYGEALAEGIPGAELCVIEGAGHGVLTSAAASQRLSDWLLGVASLAK